MNAVNRIQWLTRVNSTNAKLGWATGILSIFFSLELIIHNDGIWTAILLANSLRFVMIFIWFRLGLFRALVKPDILIKELPI